MLEGASTKQAKHIYIYTRQHLREEALGAARVDVRDALVLEVVRRVAAVQAPAAAARHARHPRPRHAPRALGYPKVLT